MARLQRKHVQRGGCGQSSPPAKDRRGRLRVKRACHAAHIVAQRRCASKTCDGGVPEPLAELGRTEWQLRAERVVIIGPGRLERLQDRRCAGRTGPPSARLTSRGTARSPKVISRMASSRSTTKASVSARPRALGPPGPSAAQPAQHQHQVQRDHLEPPLHRCRARPTARRRRARAPGSQSSHKESVLFAGGRFDVFSQASIGRLRAVRYIWSGPAVSALGGRGAPALQNAGRCDSRIDLGSARDRFSGDDLNMRAPRSAREGGERRRRLTSMSQCPVDCAASPWRRCRAWR